jgi:uncharacterized damage-inducible protein DinB
MVTSITRPQPDEIPDFFKTYVGHVASDLDGLTALERQHQDLGALARIAPDQAAYRYAEGKWSVKEVVAHMADTERVFAYRLLCIARGDKTPMPRMDENQYTAASKADRREIADLVKELTLIREASLALVRSLDETMLSERGVVRAGGITARAQVFIMAGHVEHHLMALRDRYKVI